MKNCFKRKTFSCVFCLLLFPYMVLSQGGVCDEFNVLNTKIRDGMISKDDALVKVRDLLQQIRTYYEKNNGSTAQADWVFPLEGYTSSAIGGKNGSGYVVQGFDYFDGNKHSGHPAHDIFIHDKDQDCLDDFTGNTVNVLSVTNGIVIACEQDWDAESDLRGGRYIYIYDYVSDGIFYYAHNSEIFVKPGQIVKAGDVIAHVGRTGLNAYKKRSPTHLHLMYMNIVDGYPKPKNIYKELLDCVTK